MREAAASVLPLVLALGVAGATSMAEQAGPPADTVVATAQRAVGGGAVRSFVLRGHRNGETERTSWPREYRGLWPDHFLALRWQGLEVVVERASGFSGRVLLGSTVPDTAEGTRLLRNYRAAFADMALLLFAQTDTTLRLVPAASARVVDSGVTVEFTGPENHVVSAVFDAGTFVPIRIERRVAVRTLGTGTESLRLMTVEAGRRRQAGSILLPERITWRYDGQTVSEEILESIEIGVPLGPADFGKYQPTR